MTLFFARIPTRWARERHPRLYTANPKQLLLIDASNRATAERILATQAGPVQKHHWDGLQPVPVAAFPKPSQTPISKASPIFSRKDTSQHA